MPTRARIEISGYHHVINRGVNRCDVCNRNNDKDMFLQIIHKIILYDYVLMDNHYYLFIETISKFFVFNNL
ncbi:hypothetical protein DZA35_01110 [Arcobacter sp. HD9-500m-PIT-SAG03]|nr:hypothetical protein DZA35_01110 [Arcobacter sp. HD9-500m-PIT-SAG03]